MPLLLLLSFILPSANAGPFDARRPEGVDTFLGVRDADPVQDSIANEQPGGQLRHVNDVDAMLARARTVVFDTCSLPVWGETTFEIQVLEGTTAGPAFTALSVDRFSKVDEQTGCHYSWKAPFEGDFRITAVVTKQGIPHRYSDDIAVRDLWMVSMGDSYSSGEGASDTFYPGDSELGSDEYNNFLGFQDQAAHRSQWGWPHLVAMDVQQGTQQLNGEHQVLFSFLAVSGAKLRRGMTNRGHRGPEDMISEDAFSQLERTVLLSQVRQRSVSSTDTRRAWLPNTETAPDVMVMTGGGNDIGFAAIVEDCVIEGCSPRLRNTYRNGTWDRPLSNDSHQDPMDILSDAHDTFAADLSAVAMQPVWTHESNLTQQVASEYAERTHSLSLRPRGTASHSGIFLAGYPNPMRDYERDRDGDDIGDLGDNAECEDLTPTDERWVRSALIEPMNERLAFAAAEHDYTFIDMENEFDGHGVCAEGTRNAWIRRLWRSRATQHDADGWRNNLGTMHPNHLGHNLGYRPVVSDVVVPFARDLILDDVDPDVPVFDTDNVSTVQTEFGTTKVTFNAAEGVVLSLTRAGSPTMSPSVTRSGAPDGMLRWSFTFDRVNAPLEELYTLNRTWSPESGAPCVQRVAGDCTDGIPLPSRSVLIKRVPTDQDNDGVYDPDDNCVYVANPAQSDADGDGWGKACDNCLDVPNPDQGDADSDGLGDACEVDDDDDGILDEDDNCPLAHNPDQEDPNGNGIGGACDLEDQFDVWVAHVGAVIENINDMDLRAFENPMGPLEPPFDLVNNDKPFFLLLKQARVDAEDFVNNPANSFKANDGVYTLRPEALSAWLQDAGVSLDNQATFLPLLTP